MVVMIRVVDVAALTRRPCSTSAGARSSVGVETRRRVVAGDGCVCVVHGHVAVVICLRAATSVGMRCQTGRGRCVGSGGLFPLNQNVGLALVHTREQVDQGQELVPDLLALRVFFFN